LVSERIDMEKKIEELLSQLTLDEKIGMIHGDGLFRTKGVERLSIPPLKMSDGPMGVRNEFENSKWIPVGNTDDYVTYLPSNSAVAATWNRELAKKSGQVLGAEARGRGKDVILAPGINIKRTPLCGRNFEYLSEDPYLAGELAVPMIEGIQENDTAACVKHFALNNQEIERLWVEVEADERTLREIYLPAFEKAVRKAKSYSLMGAYNRFRGEHCCESKELLNKILRKEWGYDGMVVSDWGAVHRTKEAAESGLDIEMSVTDNFDEYCMAEPLKEAVRKGEIPESLIDEKVRNILRLMFRLHMLDQEKRQSGSYNTPEHREAVLETARESVILLKNEEHLLPLSKETKRILVIGDNASRIHSNGGGSAEIKALYEISPLMGIKKLLGGNTEVAYVPGYFADDCDGRKEDVNWQADSLENGGGDAKGEQKKVRWILEKQKSLREEAVKMAGEYEQVILVGGLNHQHDSEGLDRGDMKLPYAQDELIREVLKVNPNTVIVMAAGAPVEMGSWLSEAKALVWSWYAGMEGGTALAEVLFGEVNPSGRLPETIPFSHKDCSAHCLGEYPGGKTVRYGEGIFVGYRYYDTKKVPVAYPFGYGLSYTEFVWENLQAEVKEEGSDREVLVTLTVTNAGKQAGKEVIELYVGKNDSKIERAAKELKAFTKIALEPGEKKNIQLTLSKEAFQYYDVEEQAFVVEPGSYTIYAGKSVREIQETTEITL
jgi:beta-glucosidase